MRVTQKSPTFKCFVTTNYPMGINNQPIIAMLNDVVMMQITVQGVWCCPIAKFVKNLLGPSDIALVKRGTRWSEYGLELAKPLGPLVAMGHGVTTRRRRDTLAHQLGGNCRCRVVIVNPGMQGRTRRHIGHQHGIA
jgi:hypothetical protein